MRSIYLTLPLIIMLTCSCASGQEFSGLWEVKRVHVGEEVMTPVAKWIRFHVDGSYEGGNGWLQNEFGEWSFDPDSNEFMANNKNGIKDEAGPFSVDMEDNRMTWKRLEEGMEVIVSLERVTSIPMSTADQLIGLWDLTEVTIDENPSLKNIDPNDRHYLFIRWDRIYVERTFDGKRATGYWHINGHRPDMTLLSHSADNPPESWRVGVNFEALTLTGISDSNKGVVRSYRRIQEFPE